MFKFSITAQHISLLLLSTLLTDACWATTLFGGVQHSVSLPSSNKKLQTTVQKQTTNPLQRQTSLSVPSQFGLPRVPLVAPPAIPEVKPEEPATLEQPILDWMIIPPWMAGKWNKKGDMTTSVTDLLSGYTANTQIWTDNDLTVSWGEQMDRAGNIWGVTFIPTERDGNSDGKLVHFVIAAHKCEMSSAKQLVTRTHYMVTETYSGSNQIIDMFQQESLNDFSPISSTEMQNTSSNKMFYMNGTPYRLGVVVSKWTRIGNFMPIDFKNGFDMRKSLAKYLHAQQLDHLIPSP